MAKIIFEINFPAPSLSLSPTRANKKGSFGPVSVHAWYGSSAKVVMAIWKMSRDQHMFYRSKRSSRVRSSPSSLYYLFTIHTTKTNIFFV